MIQVVQVTPDLKEIIQKKIPEVELFQEKFSRLCLCYKDLKCLALKNLRTYLFKKCLLFGTLLFQ